MGELKDAQPWETEGELQYHSRLMMIELMEMGELKDAQPWETEGELQYHSCLMLTAQILLPS